MAITGLKHIIIPLSDPVNTLEGHWRDYVLARSQRWNGVGKPPFNYIAYEHTYAFVNMMLQEIFEGGHEMQDLVTLSPSTKLLVDNGMEETTARWLAAEVFRSLVCTISMYMPDAEFGHRESFQYGLCESWDLTITPPIEYH